MIKKIHVLVLRSYIGPFLVTFLISLFILLMQFLWRYVEDFVGKGLDISVVAELMFYASAHLVPMALPLAILLSSIMTFGDLGENYELLAMKSSGISLQRIMFPLVFLIILISIGAFIFSTKALPYMQLKFQSILWDVTHQRPELNLKQGVFNKDIEGYSIKIGKKVKGQAMMYNFMIYDHRENLGNISVTVADSGTIEITDDKNYMIVTLYSGYNYQEISSKNRLTIDHTFRKDKFEKESIFFKLEGFGLKRTDHNLFKHNYQTLNLEMLDKTIDSLQIIKVSRINDFRKNLIRYNYLKSEIKVNKSVDSLLKVSDSIKRFRPYFEIEYKLDLDSMFMAQNIATKKKIINIAKEYAKGTKNTISTTNEDIYSRTKWIMKHYVEWHRKFTLAFACLVFFFIGAPLGAIIRKGGFGMPFLISILFFIFYYIISIMGEKFVKEGVLLSYEGMWMGSLIILPIGVFISYKAATDSTLLNISSYIEFLKKPFKVLEINNRGIDHYSVKHLPKINNDEINLSLDELISKSVQLSNKVNSSLKGLSFIKWHFNKNNDDFIEYNKLYDKVFQNLVVNFSFHKTIESRIKEFPVLNANKYKITNLKYIANLLLFSIFLFPIGLIVFFRSYYKIKVLKNKLNLIKVSSESIKLILTNKV